MILKAIKYTRFQATPKEWSIIGNQDDFAYLGNINLLIGKNASGKSRTLDLIKEISRMLSGILSVSMLCYEDQKFELKFHHKQDEYNYFLEVKEKKVIFEKLLINDIVRIDRQAALVYDNWGKSTPIDITSDKLIVTQVDHNGEFLFEPIVVWAKSVKSYVFANQIEKGNLLAEKDLMDKTESETKSDSVVRILQRGITLFDKAFVSEIKSDMKELGYLINDIKVEQIGGGYGITVREDRKFVVRQTDMAQGMFRALSLFILLTFARFNNKSLCLLIDDIGEGLDFERSKRLIDIAIKKINVSGFQIIMSSNDRYIMNQIPLKYWTVIERNPAKSVFYDYVNSKQVFDDFKYTGLNNFDFLSTKFYMNGFGNLNR